MENNAWTVVPDGLDSGQDVFNVYDVFPTLFLKTNIIKSGGDGSQSNPYQLAAQTEHAMPITGIVFFIYVCSKLLYADLYMMQRYKKLSCLAIMLTIYLVILHPHYYIYTVANP